MAEVFHKLERIVSLPVTYRTNGYLAVHTGLGGGVWDNMVIREGGDETKPIIPGSSIKGVVRSLIESILTQVQTNQANRICVPLPCSPRNPQNQAEHMPLNNRKIPCDAPNVSGTPCDVCQLFGNTRQRSRVTFHDAKPIASAEELSTYTRRHVAIDRRTGTQFGGAFMSVEAVPGDRLPFAGRITFINPDPWMVGAVHETLSLLQYSGVGARKSRGYGDLSVLVGEPQFIMRLSSEQLSPQTYLDNCLRRLAKIV